MAQQTINIGTVANDNTGDFIRDAFDKTNDNFTELYGKFDLGTWTPTLTNGTNVAASTAFTCHYIRIDTKVYCFGRVEVDPTAGGDTNTLIEISIPIASNFTASFDLAGVATTSAAQRGAVLYASAANDRAVMQFASQVTPATSFYFNFGYTIK